MTAPPRGTVLLVDDETYVRDSLALLLERRGFTPRTAASPQEAMESRSLDGADAVITDLRMPGGDGLDLLRRLREAEPRLPIIVLTGHGTVPSAVECMQAGAFDYLLKPTEPDHLVMTLERALGQSDLERELDYLRGNAGGRRRLVGESRSWREVLRLVELAAPTDTPVLLLGESGTGKEEIARLLHRRSGRSGGPFVAVNCAAVPLELFESEFFGHRRGAFTGAVADRAGRFRVAHRGTLFLDEINSLPVPAQAKILRVLEDGAFERIGDSRPTRSDVRLISATNSDLRREVEEGRFRTDLFYRINVVTIPIAPLRERREDIPLLAEIFRAEAASRLGRPVTRIDPDALALLQAYSWPGNVRELRNVIERGVLLSTTTGLLPANLPADLAVPAPRAGEDLHLRTSLLATERRIIEEALERAGGIKREAARLLGIDQRNMAYFLRKHGMITRAGGGQGEEEPEEEADA